MAKMRTPIVPDKPPAVLSPAVDAPSLSSIVFLLPALLGEGALTLWLLFKGVDAARWRSQAASAEVGGAHSDPGGDPRQEAGRV